MGAEPQNDLDATARAGVLLDRDGTIMADHGYVGSLERVELIEGAAEAIASFNRAGVPVAVVTNQAGVARGYYSMDDVERVHDHLEGLLSDRGAHIDLFVYCPYHPDGVVRQFARHSDDRKPGPGMAKAAAKVLGLDLASSWVVGDRPEDMALAQAIGASAAWVGPGPCPLAGVPAFATLGEAAPYILEHLGAASLR